VNEGNFCSQCKKQKKILLRIDCYYCDGKVCPECGKKKFGIFTEFKEMKNCVCDLAADNKERKCSLCNRVLPESGLKLFCSDCLGVDSKQIIPELPEPAKNPPGKGGLLGSIGMGGFVILGVLLVVIVIVGIAKTCKNN